MGRYVAIMGLALIFVCASAGSAASTYEYGVDYWFTSDTTLHTLEGWDISFELMQDYSISGIVLDLKLYEEAELVFSPIDIAIIWGLLSDKASSFTTTMIDRRLEYSWLSFDRSISKKYVTTHISNNHCIPVHEEIYSALIAIVIGDEISITGHLVNVTGVLMEENTIRTLEWGPSSTSFEDSGPGSCEIILIDSLVINGVEYPSPVLEPMIADAGVHDLGEKKVYPLISSRLTDDVIISFSHNWTIDPIILNWKYFMGSRI